MIGKINNYIPVFYLNYKQEEIKNDLKNYVSLLRNIHSPEIETAKENLREALDYLTNHASRMRNGKFRKQEKHIDATHQEVHPEVLTAPKVFLLYLTVW